MQKVKEVLDCLTLCGENERRVLRRFDLGRCTVGGLCEPAYGRVFVR